MTVFRYAVFGGSKMQISTRKNPFRRPNYQTQVQSTERQQDTFGPTIDRAEITTLSSPTDVGLSGYVIGGAFGAGVGAGVGAAIGGTVGFLLQAAGAPTDPGTLAGACAKVGAVGLGGFSVMGMAANW